MRRRGCRRLSEDLSQMNPHRRFGGSAVAAVHRRDDRRVLTDESRKRRRVLHAEIAHPVHLWFCIFDGTPCRRPAGSLGETLVELLVEREEALHVLRARRAPLAGETRSEEHTSELQSLMRISYAVFCLKKKNQ